MSKKLKTEIYRNKRIFSEKFPNAVKSYSPNIGTHIAKTKKITVGLVKADIDSMWRRRDIAEKSYSLKYPKKRRFYYAIFSERPRRVGGVITKAKVLKETPKGLTQIGIVEWNTASYKGRESTVLDFLKSKGEIPKDMFPDNYYDWNDAEKYNVKISAI